LNHPNLARFNTNGTLDTTFKMVTLAYPYGTRAITKLLRQPDGKVLIFGSFTNVHSLSRIGIARLQINGNLDNSFNPAACLLGGTASNAVLQVDGKIIVCGNFTNACGAARKGLARFYPDGTLDPDFNPAFSGGSSLTANSSLAITGDGKVL